MEREYGARVLDCAPAGAMLTAAGKVLADAAGCIEDESTTVHHKLADPDDPIPSDVVCVGSFASAIRALLLPLFSSLATTSPELGVIVEKAEERNTPPRLRRGELGLVLMERDEHTLPTVSRGMVDIPLLGESWLVVALAEQVAPSALTDLACATWINLVLGTAGAFVLDRLERQLGMSLTTWHVVYDYDIVLAMVNQGLGRVLLPELAIYSGSVPDELSTVRLPELGVRQLVVRHRSARIEPGPVIRAILEALLSQTQSTELGRVTDEGTTVGATEPSSEPSPP